jgi:hypothetical protein
VGSHRLRVETDHQINQPNRISQLCQLQEVKTKEHFIFRCPIYYEIRVRFHCLCRGAQTLTGFFGYQDQRCLALHTQEALKFRSHTHQPPPRPNHIRRITSFFTMLPSSRGTKRHPNTSTIPNSKSVWTCGTFLRPTRFQRHDQTRSPPRRRMRSPRPCPSTISSSQQRNGRFRHPTSSPSKYPTILNFLHSAKMVGEMGPLQK